MPQQKLLVASSDGFLALCRSAEGRNRSVVTEEIAKNINPTGTHVMVFQMLHNDMELRTQWFVSFKDKPLTPVELWLDVDLLTFLQNVSEIDMPEELR